MNEAMYLGGWVVACDGSDTDDDDNDHHLRRHR